MNCPHCGNRTPTTADHCLHCSARLPNQSGGFFDYESNDPDSFWNSDKLFYAIGGAVVTIFVVLAVLFGFDKYEGTCVHSAAAAARYEASPEWERNITAERMRREEENSRYQRSTGLRTRSGHHGYLRCYKKFVEHVDGVME